MTQGRPVSLAEVEAAARRIAPWVWRTPLVPHEGWSRELEGEVRLKCENLQHGGAFKSRGAANAVFALSEAEARRGVVAHSSGNHAIALARAAGLRGIPVHLAMPRNSNPTKVTAVRAYGVEPVFCEPDARSREEAAEQLVAATGAVLVHPSNDPRVIAGQGTVGLEILEQWPEVDTVVAPVGGGGLVSGILVAVKERRPDVAVIGAEPALADDAFRSLRSGRIEMPERYDTVADGLRTPLGDRTFAVIQALLDDLVLVEEDPILRATRALAWQARLIAEPSGAVALATVRSHPGRFRGRRIAVVVSGGNLDRGAVDLAALD